MLQTLLGRSATSLHELQFYVIAASYPKMLFRMSSRRFAKRYFDCFRKLESVDFKFIEHPSTATTGSNGTHPDQLLLEMIPLLPAEDIPNLRQIAKDVVKTPHEIYNKDTYMEFHRLLCRVLSRFHLSLTTLKGLQEQKKMQDSEGLQKINKVLNSAMVSGQCLRAMVRSNVIEKHLKTIAHLLEVVDEKSWMLTPADEEEIEFDALKPFSMSQGQPLQPWQSYNDWLRLIILYFDSTVILRDYVESFPSESPINISLKIFSARLPDQDQKMLPWKVLLRHNLYFPELPNDPEQPSAEALISFLTDDFKRPVVTAAGTRDEREEEDSIGIKGKKGKGDRFDARDEREEGDSIGIKGKKSKGNWFEKPKGVSIEVVLMSVQKLIDQQESAIAAGGVDDCTEGIESVTDQMGLLKNCSSPGGGVYIESISDRLKALKNCDLTPKNRLTQTREILDMFETLRGHSLLYQMLKKDTPLSHGGPFSGARHGEVCLASSLAEPGPHDSGFTEIRSNFAVSHIFMLGLNFRQFYNIGLWTSYRSI